MRTSHGHNVIEGLAVGGLNLIGFWLPAIVLIIVIGLFGNRLSIRDSFLVSS